tara:strand:- start:2553 stop:2885 length:333 start_codon:yes stop_codon:yes gene_type:complete
MLRNVRSQEYRRHGRLSRFFVENMEYYRQIESFHSRRHERLGTRHEFDFQSTIFTLSQRNLAKQSGNSWYFHPQSSSLSRPVDTGKRKIAPNRWNQFTEYLRGVQNQLAA